jgi:hypothetical protein
MPRRNSVPSYGRHAASGQARTRINGRDVYLGVYDSPESRAKYQQIVRKHLAERTKVEMGRAVKLATDVTIAEVMVRYVAFAKNYYIKDNRATSQVLLIKRALKVVLERFGSLEAREFGPRALKACRAEYVRLGWCRSEVNRAARLIVQFFKWATSEELVPGSVWESLRSVHGLRSGRTEAPDHEPVGPVPEAHVETILPHLLRAPAAMVRIQMLAGQPFTGSNTLYSSCVESTA